MLLREGISIEEIAEDLPPRHSDSNSDTVNTVVSILRTELDFHDLSHAEADVIYSLSGYVRQHVNCDCIAPAFAENIRVDKSHFYSMSRGGWQEPSSNILFLCTVATSVFNVLTHNPHKKLFLSSQNHRSFFVSCVSNLLPEVIPSYDCNHVSRILTIYFNILAKKFTKDINDSVISSTCFRKIKKLASRASHA